MKSTSAKVKAVNFRITQALYNKLAYLASSEGKTISAVLEEALTKHCEHSQNKTASQT